MLSKISFSAFTNELMKIADLANEATIAQKSPRVKPGWANPSTPNTMAASAPTMAGVAPPQITHTEHVPSTARHVGPAPSAEERASWAAHREKAMAGYEGKKFVVPDPYRPEVQAAAQHAPQPPSAPKKGGRGGGRVKAPARGGQAVGKLEQAATRGGTLRRLGAVAAKHPLLAMGGMGAMGLAGGMGAMGMRHPAQQ